LDNATAPGGDASVRDVVVIPTDGAGTSVTDLTIVTEANTSCAKTTATSREIYPARAKAIAYTAMVRVGARRFARGIGDEGFSFFDLDGANSSASPRPFFVASRFAGAPSSLVGVALDETNGGRVVAQRFDTQGADNGVPIELAKGRAYAVAIGRAADQKSLAVWSTGIDVRVRALDAEGVPDKIFDLETDAAHDDFAAAVAASVAGNGSDFLVVWSLRRTLLGEWRSYSALANTKGVVGLPRKLFGAPFSAKLVNVVTNGSGYAALFNYDGAPLVVTLDGLGRLARPGHLFDGVKDRFGAAFDIGARGGELAIVALRADRADAFRPLDGTGQALGPWVCLSDPDPTVTHSASLDCEGDACAVLYSGTGGAVQLVRTNRLGMSTP